MEKFIIQARTKKSAKQVRQALSEIEDITIESEKKVSNLEEKWGITQAELNEIFEKGEEDIAAGRVRPIEESKKEFDEWRKAKSIK